MGTTTTNLGLYKPTVGETGWGALVDANFDTLDARFPYNAAATATIYATAAAASVGTDATSAINTLITAANAAGGGTVLIPGWVRVSTGLTLKANVTLAGTGKGTSGIYFDDVDSIGFAIAGTSSVGSTLSAPVAEKDRVLNVTSSTAFVAGEWIWIQDTTISPTGPTWLARIYSKAAGVLTMYEHCPIDITTGVDVQRITSFPSDVAIRDLSLWACTTADPTAYATNRRALLRAYYTRNIEMTGCDVRGFGGNNTNGATNAGVVVAVLSSRNAKVCDNNFEWMGSTVATGVHQVVQCTYCTGVDVSSNTFYRCGGSSCIDIEGTTYAQVNGNRIGGMSQIYGSGHVISPEISLDVSGRGIKLEYGTTKFVCTGNLIYEAGLSGIRVDDAYYGSVTGNTIWWTEDMPIMVYASGAGTCHHITISGNNLRYGWQTAPNGGALVHVQNAQYVNVVGNTLSDSANIGIYLYIALDCAVANNIVENTDAEGISLGGASRRNTIHGNVVRGSTTNSIVDVSSGTANNHIWGNIIDNATAITSTGTIQVLETAGHSNFAA